MKKLRISILSFVLFLVVGISSISNVDALTTKCKTIYPPSKKVVVKTSTSVWTYQGYGGTGGGNGKPSYTSATNDYKNSTSKLYRSYTSFFRPGLFGGGKWIYNYGPWVNKNKNSHSAGSGLETISVYNVCYQIK